MYKKYLITGGTGFLGSALIRRLLLSDAKIFALVLPHDRLASSLPADVVRIYGDVCEPSSLTEFFKTADDATCVIHCAGIVSVASRPGDMLYKVNVDGTKHILRGCVDRNVAKLIYVSSVHAIPEQPMGCVIRETNEFSPQLVCGAYAKSKAMATQAVLDKAKQGFNASVVFPSGIIGPHDEARGSITSMLSAYLAGKLPFAVQGGYDFVDVRDVADGIVSCAERGERGEGYILCGQYATIREIIGCVQDITGLRRRVIYFPMCIARAVAPLYERITARKEKKLFYTPYAIKVLNSNGRFSNGKAREALRFNPRPIRETLTDTLRWLDPALCEKKRKQSARRSDDTGG